MLVSLQEPMVRAVPSRVTLPVPWEPPEPAPWMVNDRPLAVLTYGRDTVINCGVVGPTGQVTACETPVDGLSMVSPTWVGARSAKVLIPGSASAPAAWVANRGL